LSVKKAANVTISNKQTKLHDLREVRKWGRDKRDRIFIAGSYDVETLGILEKMAYWIDQFQDANFYSVLLKDFQTFENTKAEEEPQWFKAYKTRKLPKIETRLKREGVIIGRGWDKRPREWKNLVASTLYLLDECSFVFFELSFLGYGTLRELIITLLCYRKSFLFYFIQDGR